MALAPSCYAEDFTDHVGGLRGPRPPKVDRGLPARYTTGVAAEPIAMWVVIGTSRTRASRTGE